ncbi:SDR family NAD(P)-dependent oxidoreductase [Streptomyces zagrosensis]|uniref:NAD(P)-dependent dehydrogenase (Short-subunit alcohol dehydrogenase family) n=1 Tax=Streptomyces zagrosensis TaxID=1042984 RepID=A0A7W9QCJ7_9ACTN|nr:SDR family NAD(P)-dependent oxidoreductase [Streptomyces zagrosensis]MBB5937766.1 NAD(P)-dependent dehydrogenase (short-subunit alcohol dehydrogenase family) [Streptomyces zagrosensis]
MKNLVISGGTDGMGKAIALTYLRRGDRVTIVGRDPRKGEAILAQAREIGAGERVHFLRADLSLVAENRKTIDEIAVTLPAVDALVLCARYFRSTRWETADGFEGTFALEYLSRFLLSHGLRTLLEKADAPVIVNVSGPGMAKGEIRWDDFGFQHGYHGAAAQLHAGVANDLLGVAFAATYPATRTRYVLVHPGGVATSFSGEYDAESARHVAQLQQTGRPVAEGIVPIVARIDSPPAAPVSAFVRSQQINLAAPDFDERSAMRLRDLTQRLLGE